MLSLITAIVVHLGNEIEISAVTTPEEAQAAAFYSELGNMGSVARGGATLNFLGNGGAVCVWIDPETHVYPMSVRGGSLADMILSRDEEVAV